MRDAQHQHAEDVVLGARHDAPATDAARRGADASAVRACEAHDQVERPADAPAVDTEAPGEDNGLSVSWDRPALEELS